ncbi:hypothetical protein CPU12_04315 [Malaciobacter molluscorum LMG 25693]|uniref:Membrane protein n=1 Tax=Malaciobacter molluscorum LMG 25693 TaxID=870501 RepID=A0A2G1DJ29_9BACT|nr:hypothetical protein [Malaciobacter molluscorum]AXX91695.1 putative membrane protein [Malaciobacter molluscorum LMG 25693]PHO18509.1 hypothetical protein CPU12_04315 [Malaciobacter molluscorum LMG 25693]RXJ94660.1 hypothetical protein CRV00_06950 [Malaciobacter molluscorum]
MNADILNLLRDPAGLPFYPVVFQGLYILTWALHALFVFLSLGALGLSLYGTLRQKTDKNWSILTPHLIQVGKISVSLLIVLGVAPLLFTQVIYDPNWYTINTLSGLWVVIFIYCLLVGYSMYYWYYYANKANKSSSKLIGAVSFLLLIFAGLLMHSFAVQSIQPEKWMQWYAPNGVVDTSGLNFHVNTIRFLFLISLSITAIGLFLQNYSDFIKSNKAFLESYDNYIKNLGSKITTFAIIINFVLFIAWSFQLGKITDIFSIVICIYLLIFLLLTKNIKNSYISSALFIILLLIISGFREYIKFNIMNNIGYNIYDYPLNIEWTSISMFILTFVSLGGIGVTFICTMAWKVGKNNGYFDATKDKTVTLLANSVLWILSIWCIVYFAWGFFILFKNSL